MVFEQITLEEQGAFKNELVEWYNFEQVGDTVEGRIEEIFTDRYDNQRIKIWDPVGEKFMVLPGHTQLQRYARMLSPGEYIRVTLEGEEDVGRDSPMRIYAVFRDVEQDEY